MAEHAYTPPKPTIVTRRAIGAATALLAMSGAVARAANKAANLPGKLPDADLLALHPRLTAAVRAAGVCEMAGDDVPVGVYEEHDDWSDRVFTELNAACWAIVMKTPPAETAEGRALKAAAAMYQLKLAYHGDGSWPGSGEAMAWSALSEVAGEVYVPVPKPAWAAHTEPARAVA